MRLEPLLHPDRTLILDQCADREALFKVLAERGAREVPGFSTEQLLEALREREKQFPTATPEGVAFPHALLDGPVNTVLLATVVRTPIAFSSKPSIPPSDVIFCMFGSAAAPWEHVRVLARLARICFSAGAVDRLREALDGADLFQRLLTEDRSNG